MKPFTIYQNPNAVPIVSLDNAIKLLSSNDASPSGAWSGLNVLLQAEITGNKQPLVIINTGLVYSPVNDFTAWAIVAVGTGSPNPNAVDFSIQFQPDQVINLF